MWAALMDYFNRYPAQERVARALIRYGLRIEEGTIYAGDIALSDSAVGRAVNVDRRIVNATARTIGANPELAEIFRRFQPTLHLKEVAPQLNWGLIEIVPTNAAQPGILAGVSGIIAREGISIRQAIVDDPDFSDLPKLYVVTERPVPAAMLPEIQQVEGVRSVTIY